MSRISLSLLGTEVLAFQLDRGEASEDDDTMRHDPTSTTACSTETAYRPSVGFQIDVNPSLAPTSQETV